MHIPSYQINNVLKVYSRQVSQSRILERRQGMEKEPSVDKIDISSEGKRRVIIDKVAAGIVDKITRVGPQNPPAPAGAFPAAGETIQPDDAKTTTENGFVYNFIDDRNNKKTNMLSIDGSSFVAREFQKSGAVEEDG